MTFSLDPDIRTYALVPIFLFVIVASLLRRYLAALFQTTGKPNPATTSLRDVAAKQLLVFTKKFRANGGLLPYQGFLMRKALLCKKDTGLLHHPPPQLSAIQAITSATSDPSTAFDMLKGNVLFIIFSAGLGYLISALYPGFLVARAPFPLTYTFKSMLQRGISVPGLDVTYVSSFSWYFFIFVSANGLIQLICHLTDGQDADDPYFSQIAAMTGGMGATPAMPAFGQPDMKKLFEQEREAVEALPHQDQLTKVYNQFVEQLQMDDRDRGVKS